MKTFEELQTTLGPVWNLNRPGSSVDHVVVVLPSFSMGESLLSHYATRIPALEHRYLVTSLMLHRIKTCELVFLTSSGDLYRLDAAGSFGLWTRMPRGQYNRTHMLAAPDGSGVISGGFHVGRIFRVAPDGAITVLAANLADPEGIALDGRGRVYVAESSLHRIVRVGGR